MFCCCDLNVFDLLINTIYKAMSFATKEYTTFIRVQCVGYNETLLYMKSLNNIILYKFSFP